MYSPGLTASQEPLILASDPPSPNRDSRQLASVPTPYGTPPVGGPKDVSHTYVQAFADAKWQNASHRKPVATMTFADQDAISSVRNTPSLSSKVYAMCTDGWAVEMLSCIVAVMALISLCAILRYFDGHILTTMPLKININTLVAVFGALIKASVLLPVAESTYRGLLEFHIAHPTQV
jgi:hypothetical protein